MITFKFTTGTENQQLIWEPGCSTAVGVSRRPPAFKLVAAQGTAVPREVDHRTDLWSLGVVLYEMLTNQLPFKGEHEASVLYAIVHEPPSV